VLFRFLHNVHPFERGKRAGYSYSPAQLAGLDVSDDMLTLLGLDPKEPPLVDGECSAATDIVDSIPFTLLLADHALERQEVSI
jgi:hypothetical protein